MYKTKLGVTVGMLGAAVYFSGLFGGLLVLILLAGYILLFENNEWLRKSCVKAVLLVIFFDFCSAGINLIPNTIDFVNNITMVFDGNFDIEILSQIVAVISSAINIIEKILLMVLGVKAMNQGNISIPFIDKMINKNME